MPANERKPGGDWESSRFSRPEMVENKSFKLILKKNKGVMLPEECLCRRSNLSATLATPAVGNAAKHNYPIPSKAGIYSANVGGLCTLF